jgi:hypothetical protein
MTTTLTPNLTRRSELIELDGRKRAPLRGLARHERYLVSADDDGTLVLTPAVVMTELEAALLGKNPELLGRLKESRGSSDIDSARCPAKVLLEPPWTPRVMAL